MVYELSEEEKEAMWDRSYRRQQRGQARARMMGYGCRNSITIIEFDDAIYESETITDDDYIEGIKMKLGVVKDAKEFAFITDVLSDVLVDIGKWLKTKDLTLLEIISCALPKLKDTGFRPRMLISRKTRWGSQKYNWNLTVKVGK